jgi:hypothetical protein
LNTQVKRLTIYAGGKEKAEAIALGKEDIEGTCKVAETQILQEKGLGREIPPFDISFKAQFEHNSK